MSEPHLDPEQADSDRSNGPARRQARGPRVDPGAWRAYRTELHRFVARRVENASVAEDLVHDVLVRAYARRDTLRQPATLRAWLYRIARHVIVDHYRRRRPHDPLPEGLEPPAPDAPTAERDLAACLEPLLATLPAPYRRALQLADLEGRRQQDVASTLGISLSGAKSRIQRARRALRSAVLECCRVELDRRGRVVEYESRSSGCAVPARDGLPAMGTCATEGPPGANGTVHGGPSPEAAVSPPVNAGRGRPPSRGR